MSDVKVTVSDVNVDITVNEQDVIVLSSDIGPQGPRGTQVLSGIVNPSLVIGLIGDQYLNKATGFLFGPKTETGWGDGFLLGNGLQIADISYIHYQTSVSSEWNIHHDLQFTPNIIVVDLNGNVVEGDYKYNGNTIIATFSQDIAGAAYLS